MTMVGMEKDDNGMIFRQDSDIIFAKELEGYKTIPPWKRYALTITEAANYYHIGEAKLRLLVDNHPDAEFAMLNGNRVLIKRKKFERFLDEATTL